MAQGLLDRRFPLIGPLDTRPFGSQQGQGHYENYDLRIMNDAILRRFNGSPLSPMLCPAVAVDEIAAYSQENPEPFLVKDPRFAYTWPLWVRSVAPREVVGIWCRRDFEPEVDSYERHVTKDRDSAEVAVKMYRACMAAARESMPLLEVWLEDRGRVDHAARWLTEHGIAPVEEIPFDPDVAEEHKWAAA